MNKYNYKHVIVVGVDGAGKFFEDAVTPNFDRIFEKGSKTYYAYASNPTISAECWGSMLLGVSPKIHKLTNDIVSNNSYPLDSAFPSLFRRIRNAHPDAVLGSFSEWSPISTGMVENDAGVYTEYDSYIFGFIEDKKPEFLFIQFDSVDGTGHSYGYGSQKHLDRINHIDDLIGKLYSTASDAGIIDDTLFIVIADHGGTYNGEDKPASHGGWTDREKFVTFALAGKTVKKSEIIDANVRDLASIVLYALGIEAPEFDIDGWTSQIPDGIFDDDSIPEYKDISFETNAEPRRSKIQHTSEPV